MVSCDRCSSKGSKNPHNCYRPLRLLPSQGRSRPNQICFLDLLRNTWPVKHVSASRNHLHAAWKCLRKEMPSSARWGCSSQTPGTVRPSPPEGPGCSPGGAGDKDLDLAPLPAPQGISMLATRNWIPPEGQENGKGEGNLRASPRPPGSQGTLSAWNTKCKLCRAE